MDKSSTADRRLSAVDKLPEFGRVPPESEHSDLFDNIDVMMRCTRSGPDGSVETVNVLHASPAPDRAHAHLEMMSKFMEGRGFTVRTDCMPMDWHRADVLVFGVDGKLLPKLRETVDIVTHRNGLVESWDVLLYGTDSKLTTKATPPESPVCSGPAFGLDGIGVLHGHLMLRNDMRFWEGFFAYMAIELETYLDRIISRAEKDLDRKIKRLKCDLDEAGLGGDDAELAVTAAHLIRSLRNTFVHSQRNMSAGERGKQLVKVGCTVNDFCDLASAKRNQLLLGMDGYVDGLHGQLRYFTRIALITRRWMYDLSVLVSRGPP